MSRSTPTRRQALMDRQQGRCAYCAQAMDWAPDGRKAATIDHRLPKARGGTLDGDNAVLACRDCNELKGCLTAEEFMALLPQGTDVVRAEVWRMVRIFDRAAQRRRRIGATLADVWPKQVAA